MESKSFVLAFISSSFSFSFLVKIVISPLKLDGLSDYFKNKIYNKLFT